MADILFDELKPQCDYFPIRVGKAVVHHNPVQNAYSLHYDGYQWMVLDRRNNAELKQFYIEINLAKGRVVTTGLGFGLLQTTLAAKKNVKEVIVYEKHPEIIEIFNLVTRTYGVNTKKIKIINEDANTIKNIECDWLLLDHYEAAHQPYWEILDNIREVSNQNNASNVCFWPIVQIYRSFCAMKGLECDQKSYKLFVEKIKIKNLVKEINPKLLARIHDVPGFTKTGKEVI